MALLILDGNQTSTTLATTVSGGAHYPNHIIASSVTISSLPAISGTVTIGAGTAQIGSVTASISGTVPISISSVTIGNSVTISSLPAISGTVTANTYNGLNWIYVAGSFDYYNGTNLSETLYLNTYFKRVSEYRWESFNFISADDECLAYIIQEQGTDDRGYWRLYVDYQGLGGPVGSVSGILAQIVLTQPNIYSKFPPQTAWGIRTDLGFTGSVSVNYVQPETYQSQITNSVTVGSLPVQLSTTTIGGTARLNVTLSSATTVGGTVPSYGNLYGGSDGTNLRAISVDTSGRTVVTGSVSVASTTVTISAQPSGALTTRFGSVTTANTAQITTAVTNTSRKYLLAQNISTGTVTIGIGFSPTTTQGIQLTAGAGLTFDSFVPTGAVYWLGATTGAAYTILEG